MADSVNTCVLDPRDYRPRNLRLVVDQIMFSHHVLGRELAAAHFQ